MSLMKLETILCDFGETCEIEPPWYGSRVESCREAAAEVGWTQGSGFAYDGRSETLDFCPVHSGTRKTEEPWPPPVEPLREGDYS